MNLQHMQCFSKNYCFCLLILYFILDYFVCVCVAHLKAEFSGSFQFGDVNMFADVIYSFSAKNLLLINYSYWKRSMKEIAFANLKKSYYVAYFNPWIESWSPPLSEMSPLYDICLVSLLPVLLLEAHNRLQETCYFIVKWQFEACDFSLNFY